MHMKVGGRRDLERFHHGEAGTADVATIPHDTSLHIGRIPWGQAGPEYKGHDATTIGAERAASLVRGCAREHMGRCVVAS